MDKNKCGPVEVLKKQLISQLQENFFLLEEKESIEKNMRSAVIPYKNYSFLQKHIFKRKEYKEYLFERRCVQKKLADSREIDNKRIAEIENLLSKYDYNSITMIQDKIKFISDAESFDELGVNNPSMAIQFLMENGINPNFDSFSQAFEMASDYLGKNIDFMRDAIKSNREFIKYDKTNDENLYIEVIDLEIKEIEKMSENQEIDFIKSIRLEELKKCKEELKSPRKVDENKYKVPHRFMFEEIRNNGSIYYSSVDGVYSKKFGMELEQLYDDPNIILGIHGLSKNGDIENDIFRQGLKNSMQTATTHASRTIAYGKSLTFTTVLNYRIPYNGMETEAAIIILLPKNAFDAVNPELIWGSNEYSGENNYILPQYIYGVYHGTDGAEREIIKNTSDKKVHYEYLKSDASTIHMVEKNIDNNEKTL